MEKFRALALSVMFLVTIMMIGYAAHQFNRAEELQICVEHYQSIFKSVEQCIVDEQANYRDCVLVEVRESENICDGVGWET